MVKCPNAWTDQDRREFVLETNAPSESQCRHDPNCGTTTIAYGNRRRYACSFWLAGRVEPGLAPIYGFDEEEMAIYRDMKRIKQTYTIPQRDSSRGVKQSELAGRRHQNVPHLQLGNATSFDPEIPQLKTTGVQYNNWIRTPTQPHTATQKQSLGEVVPQSTTPRQHLASRPAVPGLGFIREPNEGRNQHVRTTAPGPSSTYHAEFATLPRSTDQPQLLPSLMSNETPPLPQSAASLPPYPFPSSPHLHTFSTGNNMVQHKPNAPTKSPSVSSLYPHPGSRHGRHAHWPLRSSPLASWPHAARILGDEEIADC